MAKPSIYAQLAATQVKGEHLPPSPRHFNPGLLRYKGRLWMVLRYHLGREHASRCALGMVPIDKTTLQPIAPYQHLNLPAVVGDEHFEDARLFLFKGQPHISYTQMTGYRPGVDYTCTMKYARLKLNGNRWLIEETFYPQFGRNHGGSKEKNWIFFEHNGALYVIYQDAPRRIVLRLDGDRVVEQYESDPPVWPWGEIRGGTPPVPCGDGQMLAVFHSSLPTEQAPHFVRYYGAAYTFEAKPPFRITAISHKPLIAGSEMDGHGADPRYAAGWKPFVVFPCGLVPPMEGTTDPYLVSLGVNDWQCAVGRMTREQLHLGLPDRSDAPFRYFATTNGSLPARMVGSGGMQTWLQWEIPRTDRRGASAAPGLYATNDGREAEAMADAPNAEEITEEQYHAAGGRRPRRQALEPLVFG